MGKESFPLPKEQFPADFEIFFLEGIEHEETSVILTPAARAELCPDCLRITMSSIGVNDAQKFNRRVLEIDL